MTADKQTFFDDFSDEHFCETCDDLGNRLRNLLPERLLDDLKSDGFESRMRPVKKCGQR